MTRHYAAACLLLGFSGALLAQTPPTSLPTGLSLLKKVTAAANNTTYAGTFVHQQNGQVETLRVSHALPDGIPVERIETLEGTSREVLRWGDMTFHYQQGKFVRAERGQMRRSFPRLLQEPVQTLLNHYHLRITGNDRVAGFDCQILAFDPKDSLRYSQQICVETKTGLILRAITTNERAEIIDHYAFTQISLQEPDGEKLRKYVQEQRQLIQNHPYATPLVVTDTESPWQFDNLPPGFYKVRESQRQLPGRPNLITHVIFSDGLAIVSVFIDAQPQPRLPMGLSRQGVFNIYTRHLGTQQITALGEAPALTLQQITNAVQIHKKTSKP